MLALSSASLSLVHGINVPTNVARASSVVMKSEIVLADKEVEAKIMAVVNAEPASTKSAAMCSQMAAVALDRIRMDQEDGGCDRAGPPFTQPTGLGWDSSTEPKNKEDMIALAFFSHTWLRLLPMYTRSELSVPPWCLLRDISDHWQHK